MRRTLWAAVWLSMLLSAVLPSVSWAADPHATVVQGSATGTPIPVSGSFSFSGGTVTANQGTAGLSAWLVTQSGGPWTLIGTLLNNNAAPSSNNLGVLSVRANAVAPSWTEGNLVTLSSDLTGSLRTQITNTPTVTANAGSGTFTVSGTVNQGTGGSSAWKVDGSAVTQPISAASLPLPAGASTSAKQPALGTAGTASSDVITVQGISGMTAVKVDGSGVTQPVSGTVTANAGSGTFTVGGTVTANAGTGTFTVDASGHTVPISAASLPLPTGASTEATLAKIPVAQGSTTSGQNGSLVQGAVTTAAPSYTTAQTSPLSLTTAGALRVDASATTQPVSGTVTANQGGAPWSVSQSGTWNVGLNSGTNTVGNVGVAQGSTTSGQSGPLSQGAVTTAAPSYTTAQTSPLSLTTAGALRVDGSAVTQPVSGTVTANAGSGTFTVGGTVTSNAGTGTFTVAGSKTNNNTAPGATNVGTLGAVANASAPSFTEGNQVGLSTDLSGSLRAQITNTPTVTANAGSGTFTVSGTVTANAGTGTRTVAGTLTNNNAAPTTTNVGALVAVANAASPTWTEGDQVLASVDLSGRQRTLTTSTTTGTPGDAFTAPGAVPQAQVFPEIWNGATNDRPYSANAASNTTGTGVPAAGLMGFDGTNWQRVSETGVGGGKAILTGIGGTSGSIVQVQNAAGASDGLAGSNSGLTVEPYATLYNNATWDRFRNNTSNTILTSAARTTTQTTSVTTYNAHTMTLLVNVTSIGTGSITPSVTVVDSVSGSAFTVWTAAAAITSNGLFAYRFEPGNTGTTGGSYTEKITTGVPGRTLQVVNTANNANSVTYSCSLELE